MIFGIKEISDTAYDEFILQLQFFAHCFPLFWRIRKACKVNTVFYELKLVRPDDFFGEYPFTRKSRAGVKVGSVFIKEIAAKVIELYHKRALFRV